VTRFVSVIVGGARRAAIVEDDRVLVGQSEGLDELLRRGGELADEQLTEHAPADVEFDAPLRPAILLCCGQNYTSHLAEQSQAERSEPEFFIKAGATIAAPGDPFSLDRRVTRKLDYETELGVVIGRDAGDVSPGQALDHVFGYVVVNDLSARDRQVKEGGRMAHGPGKNFNGATRLGQSIVPAAEIAQPQALALTTRVNAELRQSDTTANMIFSCAELVSRFSRLLMLPAGTIISTGTPGGTGLGCDASLGGKNVTPAGCAPARYLEPGDVVISEIDDVGSLSFDVVEAPERPPAGS
jgi:2-keto-4-pentenoate hydratase/2-oxohepta-3-ene-1,7-dioic acid hydratase in catechol pathway